jgi:dihydrolipoamide dehydrogenase
MEIRTDARVVGGKRQADSVRIDIEQNGKMEMLEGDHVLVSVGRRPSLTGVDAKALGIATGRRGEIIVDDQMRTNLPNVFAIGDAIGGKLLAHKAEEEGVVAAEVIAGKPAHMHYRSIPSVVYTWPEVASVGLTEDEVKQSGREYRAGKFPFSANGRARTMGESAGFVKFIADAKTDALLGAHLVGPNVSELVAEVVMAFEFDGSSEDIGITVHAHPTLAETVKEAALGVLGRSIHI